MDGFGCCFTSRGGNGCLFAGGVDVMVSDMHSLIDIVTGSRLNPARDVTIEDKVWIGQNATLLKVLRQGVTWRHDLI